MGGGRGRGRGMKLNGQGRQILETAELLAVGKAHKAIF